MPYNLNMNKILSLFLKNSHSNIADTDKFYSIIFDVNKMIRELLVEAKTLSNLKELKG